MADTMKAYRIVEEKGPGGWHETSVPTAASGEVVLQVAAAGLCRTDLELMDHGAQYYPWTGPFTVGHETAGHIVEVGANVVGLSVGDSVVVHANSSCGLCANCRAGRDNFCLNRPSNYGYADDGGLAPFMKARQRDVVQLGSLDPRVAAPIADAGTTAYGALLDVRPHLKDDGFVVVIGIGGVGGVVVQLLRALTGVHVIALDRADRLGLATSSGAHHVLESSPDAVGAIMDLTGGRGADAVIDIVGSNDTLALAASVVAPLGAVSIVGLTGGTYPFGFMTQQVGARFFASTTCALAELSQLVTIFQREGLQIPHQTFAFADIETAYDALRAGTVAGRAVIDYTL